MPGRRGTQARGKARSTNRDTKLLQGVEAASPESWPLLVDRYGPAVRAVVELVADRYREPVSTEDVDAVTAEVFEHAAADRFRWLRELTRPEMLGPSLRTLAAWRTLVLLRAKYRTFTCSLEGEAKVGKRHVATAVLAGPPESEHAPRIDRAEVNGLVEKFVKDVGERPTQVLESVYRKRKPYQEIAEKQGIPLASVAQIIFDGRRQLAQMLAEAAPEAGL